MSRVGTNPMPPTGKPPAPPNAPVPPLTDDMLRYAMAAMGTGSPADAEKFRLFWRFASEAAQTAAPAFLETLSVRCAVCDKPAIRSDAGMYPCCPCGSNRFNGLVGHRITRSSDETPWVDRDTGEPRVTPRPPPGKKPPPMAGGKS